MMASFILCLFLALLATTRAQAETLTCEKCYGTVDTCKNPTQTCTALKATGGCVTVLEENTLGGTKMSGFYKDCMPDYHSGINVPITFTAGTGKYLRVNVTRCNNADKCNSAVLDVPKENTALNGRQCPTCFTLNSYTCDSQITPCRGDENYCIDFAGTLTLRSYPQSEARFVVKGCATASAEGIKTGDALYSAVFRYTLEEATSKPALPIPTTPQTTTTPKATTAATSGGSPALGKFSFALYLPGLAGLLLLKLLS